MHCLWFMFTMVDSSNNNSNEFNAVGIFIDLCSKHVVCALMLHG